MIDISDFNIKKVSTKFIVNEKKRTVVCVITTINDVPIRLAKYGLGDEALDETDLDIRIYKGIAKCSPEDKWDETFGKRLAEYRASRARQADVNKDLKDFIRSISRRIDDLYDYGLLKNPHEPD